MRNILVTYESKVFGNGVLWFGSEADIETIPNVLAKKMAKLVAKDGKSRKGGMWCVDVVETRGALIETLKKKGIPCEVIEDTSTLR